MRIETEIGALKATNLSRGVRLYLSVEIVRLKFANNLSK